MAVAHLVAHPVYAGHDTVKTYQYLLQYVGRLLRRVQIQYLLSLFVQLQKIPIVFRHFCAGPADFLSFIKLKFYV